MHAPAEQRNEAAAYDRSIEYLSGNTGTPLAQVRVLLTDELARLESGATVRTYLHVLATSNIRARLRRALRPHLA